MTAPGSITIVRTFACPVDELFAAWTDPALLRRWLSPSLPGFSR